MNDDLISRQAAIDAISCNITITGRQNAELVAATIGSFADRIKALPTAQPERKKGKWIPGKEIAREFLAGNVLHVDYLNYRCSACGAIVGERETIMYHFCPNCGADMRGGQE